MREWLPLRWPAGAVRPGTAFLQNASHKKLAFWKNALPGIKFSLRQTCC